MDDGAWGGSQALIDSILLLLFFLAARRNVGRRTHWLLDGLAIHRLVYLEKMVPGIQQQ